LIEAHDSFKASLSAAQSDFNQLAALDKQIKSFNVGVNPYTWFTMEALEETWRNLQKIIAKGQKYCQIRRSKIELGFHFMVPDFV
jgi:spectrin alpha